eukprot:CAMPEP_0113583824 /NCGR_PEP_ID=MMETSP0015_2-20120614/32744_1 /TAXON_ID=2838 /ORGANISM="Odontella" /LENGTH=386 /DNA_ID=CAMNT_0000488769 /DNA_START=64 /DNA_END=1224 /DNA_ORIENTATION=- /assembly_acc=CAM_ASM_000160
MTSHPMSAANAVVLLMGACVAGTRCSAFQYPSPLLHAGFKSPLRHTRHLRPLFMGKGDDIDLKAELTDYLRVRKERNADDEAKKVVGKVVGGTRGNKVLDYVSGSPNKEFTIKEAPNVFDYDELIKYGFGYLVAPIMDAGGRMEAYRLVDMTPPPIPDRAKPKSAPKLVIDYTGETDPGRYSGLKMGQVVDDDEMGRRLAEVQEKAKKGERLRPKIAEEDYVQPYADKRNTGPKMVPDWTPEKIDEQARRAGKAIAWAKKAKAGEFKKDPYEILSVEGSLQWYCTFSALLIAFAFGRASSRTLGMAGIDGDDAQSLLHTLQAPGLALLIAAVGSSICAAVLASGKNRSGFVWAVKGLLGGPLAVLQLRDLDSLITRGEAEAAEKSA